MSNIIYLSPRRAAERLQVNPKLIYSEVQSGRLRAIRVGTKILRIPLHELERWEQARLEETK